MYTGDELFKKLEDLRGMHEHSGHWEYRDRMRDILNGGSRGVAAVSYTHLTLPTILLV